MKERRRERKEYKIQGEIMASNSIYKDYRDQVFSTGIFGQPRVNLYSNYSGKQIQQMKKQNRRRARSQIVMKALPDGMDDIGTSSDVKSDKAPWQRGFETYVKFNGNPLEKVLPFIPKQVTTIDTPKIQKEGMFQNTAILFKYDQNFDQIFGVLDDVVMGGKSQSNATIENDDGSYIKFEGVTDTNGGGFCSVRTKNFSSPLDLSEFNGITFRARSLKNFNYKLNLRDEENWDSIAW